MTYRAMLALIVVLLSVSACVVEPIGGRGGYHGGHDEGRRVWR